VLSAQQPQLAATGASSTGVGSRAVQDKTGSGAAGAPVAASSDELRHAVRAS
jgi:hypothetical protein